MLRKLFGAARRDQPEQRPPSALDELAPALLQAEEWRWPPADSIRAELLDNVSGRLWKDIPGGHKWLSYFDAYDDLFGRFRGTAPRVLEIGVDRGGSLILWQRFFGPGVQLTGIDINPDCARFERADEGVHVRIGSQADPAFLERVCAEFGPFDIIVDDGSHVVSHQIASFNALFDRAVRPGGIYMVEDLETSYWGHRSGQSDRPCTFIDVARAVLDVMHRPYADHDYPAFRIEAAEGQSLTVPRLAKLVDQIRFYDSIAAFYRRDRLPPVVEYLPDA